MNSKNNGLSLPTTVLPSLIPNSNRSAGSRSNLMAKHTKEPCKIKLVPRSSSLVSKVHPELDKDLLVQDPKVNKNTARPDKANITRCSPFEIWVKSRAMLTQRNKTKEGFSPVTRPSKNYFFFFF